jgi:hypothetical protein
MKTQLHHADRATDLLNVQPRTGSSRRLVHPKPPAHSPRHRPTSSLGPSAPSAPPESARGPTTRPQPLAPDRGLRLLYGFVVGTAVMVGAFVVAGAVAEMWILIPGMTAHLLMTFLVLSAIARLMADSDDE